MKLQIKQLAALSALALIGTGSAHASIILANAAGGSEAIMSFVNANGDSVSLDLGQQMPVSGNFTLPATVVNFISTAGGVANVTFGIIAGDTTTRTYLTSSASQSFFEDTQVANSAKSLWAGSLSGLITNLNTGDATLTSTNLAYGPFLTGSGSSNYLDGGYDTWQSGDFAFSNLTAGNTTLFLYTVEFSTANTGLVSFTPGSTVTLSGDGTGASVGVVPAPAAVWLLGTALLPLARRACRKSRATA